MKAIDVTGQVFGRLTVVEKHGSLKGEGVLWKCKCSCGNETIVTGKNLRSGNTKSCGCLIRDTFIDRNKSRATHGQTGSPTFISWDSMKQRVLNPSHKSYENYGGRGITICERWLESFENFVADMGERPEGMTLDRIDTNGNYEPENCRWATDEVQGNNKRSSKLIEFQGRTQTSIQWAREFGIHPKVLLYRLKNGWSIEEALTMKTNHGNAWARGSR